MPLSDNLLLDYPLNEASGAAVDSVAGENLTQNGTVGTRTGVGGIGAARDFSGSNSNYLSHVDSVANSSGDTDWSVLFWFLVDGNLSNFPALATKGFQEGGTNREWMAYLDPSAGFRVQFREESTGTPDVASGDGAVSTGVWYMGSFGNNSTLNEGWVSRNAGTPATRALSLGTNNGTGTLRLGMAPATGCAPLDGGIQRFSVFRRDIRSDLAAFLAAGPTWGGGSPPPPSTPLPVLLHSHREQGIAA
jgi:hypothetical protein